MEPGPVLPPENKTPTYHEHAGGAPNIASFVPGGWPEQRQVEAVRDA